MQRWKTVWMLAAMALVMTACPSDEEPEETPDAGLPDAGSPDAGTQCTADAQCGAGRRCNTATGQCVPRGDTTLGCSSDTDCLEAEICHPSAKVCVQTCLSAADCPVSAKTCAPMSATDTRKVCQCSTNELCNWDRQAADLVCSNLDRVCTPRCLGDLDCSPGRTCDAATGQCQYPRNPRCTGEGQSTCLYGTEYCHEDQAQCTRLPEPSCENFQNFSAKGSLGTTGPILYGARLVSAERDTLACGESNPIRAKISIKAYSSQPFPPARENLTDVFYVRTNGTIVPVSELVFSTSDYVVSGANRENAEIVVSLCRPAGSLALSAGFYFTNGNFRCFATAL